jgi:hypothetical protein
MRRITPATRAVKNTTKRVVMPRKQTNINTRTHCIKQFQQLSHPHRIN